MSFSRPFASSFAVQKNADTHKTSVPTKPSQQADLFGAAQPVKKPVSIGLSLKKSKIDQTPPAEFQSATAPVRPVSSEPAAEELIGKVSRVIYETSQGFAVYLLRIDGGKDVTVTVTSAIKAKKGDKIVAKGLWGTYKGKPTFKATLLKHDIPKGARGIVTWLKTGSVPGVGKTTAENIAKAIGDEILDIIGDADALWNVLQAGPRKVRVTRKQCEDIAETWTMNNNQDELVEFLGRFGIGEMTIGKISKRYGGAARRVVQNTPWVLAETIDGIGFSTADEIAMEAGHPKNSPVRIEAGVRYMLDNVTRRDGHCGLPQDILIKDSSRMLDVSKDLVTKALDKVVKDGSIIFDEVTDLIYPKDLHFSETELAKRLIKLLDRGDRIPEDQAKEAIEAAIAEMGVSRDESQVAAAVMAVCSPISVITGGPGTGKSTTQKIIVRAFAILGKEVVLAAPTGRAAKRLSEVSGTDASTCHRLLSFNAEKGGFEYDASNPFPVDRVITDEFSMVDVRLGQAFMDAVRKDAAVVIVGDVDQLPSVGQGQVLRDAIESGVIPVTRLKTVHRQKGDSGIVVAAARIKEGLHPVEDGNPLNGFEVFTDFERSYDSEVFRAKVVELMAVQMKALGYDPIQDVQILSPQRKGDLGILALNEDLKHALNPSDDKNSVEVRKRIFSIGDRVMHLRNDYVKKVYNGEVGTVTWVGHGKNKDGNNEPRFKVDYSGYEAFYGPEDVNDVELSWATTVHKSQGCEFPVVIFVCSDTHKHMLSRNLLYTAVTRAKKLCVVIGHDGALLHAVNTNEVNKRYTGLAKKLRHLKQPETELPFG